MATSRPNLTLDSVIDADTFTRWAEDEVAIEADFTEANNEDRTLADYIADLDTRLQRMLAGEFQSLTP